MNLFVGVPHVMNLFAGTGSWVLGPVSWVLGPGSWVCSWRVPHVMNPVVGGPARDESVRGYWVLDPGPRTQDPGPDMTVRYLTVMSDKSARYLTVMFEKQR